MSRENLARCRSLIDQGAHADSWIALARLHGSKPKDMESVNQVITEATAAYQANYVEARNQLRRLIQKTDSAKQVSTCLEAMSICQDYAGLASCRSAVVKIDNSKFFLDFPDFVDSYLIRAKFADSPLSLEPTTIEGVRTNRAVLMGSFLTIRCEEADVTTPLLYDGAKRIEMGEPVWAADFDPATGRHIMTLPQSGRVVGVNAETGETEATIESPLPGVRGIHVLPNLRRGFFVSELGNRVISFDLDDFEIRKQIKGFSVRPERLRAHAATNTMITGNLGWGLAFPFCYEPDMWRAKCSDEGKVTDGASVSIIDVSTESVIGTIATGRRPTAVAISDTYIVAGNFYDNTLTVYERNDLSKPRLISLDMFATLALDFQLEDRYEGWPVVFSKRVRSRVVEGITIVDRRGWVLVSGWDVCVLTVIGIQTGKVEKIIPVQNAPFDVVVDADEKYAYVSCRDSFQISVVDLDQGCEVCRLQTGPSPQDLRLVGDTLLVGDNTGLNIFDLKDLAREGLIT